MTKANMALGYVTEGEEAEDEEEEEEEINPERKKLTKVPVSINKYFYKIYFLYIVFYD